MLQGAIVAKLRKFKMVDKYRTFYKVQPYALFAGDDQHDTVTLLLDDCCRELIKLYEAAKKKPTKTSLKKTCSQCMNELMKAPINTENREFGYELCWYLSEIVQVDLLKTSSSKKWGYKRIHL
ncbi:MAG: hypothetical protein H0X33_01235 [Taibaiella sp.]|nr:hypothetical protein [Taibaiella sp.]